MRIGTVLYAVGLAAALILYRPAQAVELNELIPEETLLVEKAEEGILVRGAVVRGIGADWNGAMRDLQQTAEGRVFLETVDRIVVAEQAAACLEELQEDPRLRPSAQLYLLRGRATPELEAFLRVRKGRALGSERERIPRITEREGSYYLE